MDPMAQFALLFLAGLIGESYSSAVGGLSLVTVPALIFAGLSPIAAIATNIAAQLVPNVICIANYRRHGKLKAKGLGPMALLFALGATIGSIVILQIPQEFLRVMIAFFIICSIFLVLAREKVRFHRFERSAPLQWVLLSLIGAYKSIFGASAKTLTMAYLISIRRMPFVESSAAASLLLFLPVTIASASFVMGGAVDWNAFLPLTLGAGVGALFGSQLAVKKGDSYVKWLLIAVALLGIIALFI